MLYEKCTNDMNKNIKTLIYIYGVRIYTAVISIVLIPFIIDKVGIEAYGLIGFFTVLQACLSILDAGIGGVITREAITSQSSYESFSRFNGLYKKVIAIFLAIALLIIFVGWFTSVRYSNSWLQTKLDHQVVITCSFMMFIIFSLRYIQGPFRSIILANESQIKLTTINFIAITISQPVAFILIKLLDKGIVFYFLTQLFSAVVSCAMMVYYSEKIRKKIYAGLLEKKEQLASAGAVLTVRKMLNFALQLSSLSILWVLVSQSDKLTLSRYMNLSDYGHYSVAVSFTAILAILSDPLNQYLQPRLVKCYHERDFNTFTRLYVYAFNFIALITIPLGAFLFYFGRDLLFVWSGSAELSDAVIKYLPPIFLGGVFAVFSNLIFLLLYSLGDLKKHTIVYFIFSIFLIPLNIVVAQKYLGTGSSVLYMFSSAFLFIAWGAYNLVRYFTNGIRIITVVIAPVLIFEFIFFYYSSHMLQPLTTERLKLFVAIFSIGLVGFVLAAIYLFFTKAVNGKIIIDEVKV